VSWDLRLSKAVYIRHDPDVKVNVIAQAQNLLNRVNFSAVNNVLPADPNAPLLNGGTLAAGPYSDIHGIRPADAAHVGSPFMFAAAYPPRYVSLGLRVEF
jgi:hypothetical protein